MNIETAVLIYLNHLQTLQTHGQLVSTSTGKKFIKVIVHSPNGLNKSVHAFIDRKTGDLLKPAGWNVPTKDVRYNLLTQMDLVKQVADPYGTYLYRDFINSNIS